MRSNKVINKGEMHCSHNISLTLLFEEMYADKVFSGEY